MRPHLCIVVVLLHSFPLKKVCWQSVGTMQFTSGLSFVLYNNFSLAAQCTVELGMPAACQGGSCIKCLDLYSDIYSLEQIRIISKPHMFAGMKEPFFGVIPIGATQDIDYAQCGWVVASGHSETLCSYFGCRLAPLLDFGRDIEQPSSPQPIIAFHILKFKAAKALACTPEQLGT
jgi:hypothetical protein